MEISELIINLISLSNQNISRYFLHVWSFVLWCTMVKLTKITQFYTQTQQRAYYYYKYALKFVTQSDNHSQIGESLIIRPTIPVDNEEYTPNLI